MLALAELASLQALGRRAGAATHMGAGSDLRTRPGEWSRVELASPERDGGHLAFESQGRVPSTQRQRGCEIPATLCLQLQRRLLSFPHHLSKYLPDKRWFILFL